jgi:hypothetical protein
MNEAAADLIERLAELRAVICRQSPKPQGDPLVGNGWAPSTPRPSSVCATITCVGFAVAQ